MSVKKVSNKVRCSLGVLSGWLVVFDDPNGAMLWGHLRMDHPAEVGAYLEQPNLGVQATAYSVRSAPASRRA
jgi:hypothetical protein